MSSLRLHVGSEWHLLRYLARHRADFCERIRRSAGLGSLRLLDRPTTPSEPDREWQGLEFLERRHPDVQAAWRRTWPQVGTPISWDEIGVGDESTWLLLEAKAHAAECASSCNAKTTSRRQIAAVLDDTKRALEAQPAADWLSGHYQAANRLAVLHFLVSRGVDAHLIYVYFTGAQHPGRNCPASESEWRFIIDGELAHLGLPREHALSGRVARVFLPVPPSTLLRHVGRQPTE